MDYLQNKIIDSALGEYGEYIIGLKNRKIQLYNGVVELNNLSFKEGLADKLNLPFKFLFSHISKVYLNIPWGQTDISSAVTGEVEDVFIVITPKKVEDIQKISIDLFDIKQTMLESIRDKFISDYHKVQNQKSQEPGAIGRMVAKIQMNLKIKIKNLHIRVEIPDDSHMKPFAFGATLNSLNLYTVDENGKETFFNPDDIKNQGKGLHKIFDLNDLAIYWNTVEQSYCMHEYNNNAIINKLNDGIRRKDKFLENYEYLLHFSSEANYKQMMLDQNLIDNMVPHFTVQIDIEKNDLMFNNNQYVQLIHFSKVILNYQNLEKDERLKNTVRHQLTDSQYKEQEKIFRERFNESITHKDIWHESIKNQYKEAVLSLKDEDMKIIVEELGKEEMIQKKLEEKKNKNKGWGLTSYFGYGSKSEDIELDEKDQEDFDLTWQKVMEDDTGHLVIPPNYEKLVIVYKQKELTAILKGGERQEKKRNYTDESQETEKILKDRRLLIKQRVTDVKINLIMFHKTNSVSFRFSVQSANINSSKD